MEIVRSETFTCGDCSRFFEDASPSAYTQTAHYCESCQQAICWNCYRAHDCEAA